MLNSLSLQKKTLANFLLCLFATTTLFFTNSCKENKDDNTGGTGPVDPPVEAEAGTLYSGESQFNMIVIPKGSFTMGSTSREVTISYNFAMSETPITQALYTATTGKIAPSRADGQDSVPVHFVYFADAINFCNSISAQKGLQKCYTIDEDNITCNFDANGYRLPTEAEWEYAAKAGTGNEWGFYDDPLLHTWCAENTTGTAPNKVKTKLPNSWNLYDMNGNVYEWCWDWFSYSYSETQDPTGPASGSSKSIRGGSFVNGIDKAKATERSSFNPFDHNYNLGFRIVRRL